MTFVLYAREVVSADIIRKEAIEKRSTYVRKLHELACGRALFHGGFGHLPSDLTVGIVGVTDYGDRYPELCRQVRGRLRPHQFSSSVLNSSVGHCALVFGLTGPQITINRPARPDAPFEIARYLLAKKRAELMLVVDYVEDEGMATATLMGVSK